MATARTRLTVPPDWPRPLRLLAVLLARDPAPLEEPAPLAAALSPEDWSRFATLAIEEHRLAPVLAPALARHGIEAPEPVAQAIAEAARQAGLAALAQKAETARLVDAFGAEGLEPLVLKGWPLAERLFASAAARQAKDIDLMVAPEMRCAAAAVLARLGYRPQAQHRLRARCLAMAAVAAECNDIAYCHPERGLQVELHWRSHHFRGWPDLADHPDERRSWPLDATGRVLRVPSARAELAYLAGHGESHLWLRLKWLHDIARIAETRAPEALGADLAFAERIGAGGTVRRALGLASAVFGAPVPPGWPGLGADGERAARRILAMIADLRYRPGSTRASLARDVHAWAEAERPGQRRGVLRYRVWRRLRLGLAGLSPGGAG